VHALECLRRRARDQKVARRQVRHDETPLTRTTKRSDTYDAVRRGSRFTIAICIIASQREFRAERVLAITVAVRGKGRVRSDAARSVLVCPPEQGLARPRQFIAARSIVGVAMRPLKHLTEQANSGSTKRTRRPPRGLSSSESIMRRPRRILAWRLAAMADRDLAWPRPDSVLLGGKFQ
jgi:hypothetical protein